MKKKFSFDPFYEEVLLEMKEAATVASHSWLLAATQRGPAYSVHEGTSSDIVGTMLDCCGGAYLKIVDGRKSFCKYVKARQLHLTGDSYCRNIPVEYHHQCRQEMGLHESAKTAAFNVLKKYSLSEGIQFYSFID